MAVRSEVRVHNRLPEASAAVRAEMVRHVNQAALHLQTEAKKTLSGGRTGRRYRIPGTKARRYKSGRRGPAKKYTASAPNEPPAVRLGTLRNSVFASPAKLVIAGAAAVARVGSRGLKPAYGRILELRKKHARPWLAPTFAREAERVRKILSSGWRV